MQVSATGRAGDVNKDRHPGAVPDAVLDAVPDAVLARKVLD
jgi:hypothetical protein